MTATAVDRSQWLDEWREANHAHMTGSTQAVILAAASCADVWGEYIEVPQSELGERVGLSRERVGKALGQAVEEGWLEVVRQGGNGLGDVNVYRLTAPREGLADLRAGLAEWSDAAWAEARVWRHMRTITEAAAAVVADESAA